MTTKRAHRTYTRQQVLAALKKQVAEQGEAVTLDQFRRESGISMAPIGRLFGSWSALRIEAGLSPRGKKPSPAMFTHTQLCEMLTEAVRVYGEEITLEQFLQAAGISATPVYHLFGSWPALRQAAGLVRRLRAGWSAQYRPVQMAHQVDALMRGLCPPTSLKELIARSGLSRAEVEAEFGSWEDLCEYLVIETRGDRIEALSDDEMLRLLQWCDDRLQRIGVDVNNLADRAS